MATPFAGPRTLSDARSQHITDLSWHVPAVQHMTSEGELCLGGALVESCAQHQHAVKAYYNGPV